MSRRTASIGARHPWLGAAAYHVARPIMRGLGRLASFHAPDSAYAKERIASLRDKLERGETTYLIGIGPGGHNAGVSLVEVSRDGGVRILGNHEEERFRAIKHYMKYPSVAVRILAQQMKKLGIDPGDIHAAVASWDYPQWTAQAARMVGDELPGSVKLLSKRASPAMNSTSVFEAFKSPRRLGKTLLGKGRLPVINLRHHDNHAYFSYGVSPFASDESDEPVMILVVDGAGDDGAISHYVARNGRIELLYKNNNFWDSLGMMYGVLSSTQGGWPLMHSEGRYMGAAAWGNSNRHTNPYYSKLRDIFHFGNEGRVYLNRSLARWQRGGCVDPYTKRLSEIFGKPIPLAKMWNPDAVLNVEDVKHADITRDRVDKAAAVQLVFEDALFHIVHHLIRKTQSTKLVLTGGTALNCVANMRLLEQFDTAWYERYLGKENARLHLWVPPTPNDEGVGVGAAYHFACLAGAKPGTAMEHAFYCGLPPTRSEIEQAFSEVDEVAFEPLGNVNDDDERERIADLLAYIIAADGVAGIFQGVAETGPRALGHRSILANPANPKSLDTLNSLVKFRERIRPLAPMATLAAAQRFFHLSPGASDDEYNAYNYMVLTAQAKPEAFDAIPAVIHHDGTGRVQIVREHVDPFCFAYLRAMGRRIGAEVSVNTSLNVGAPIAQTPRHALETLKKSKGMDGLFLISEEGDAWVAWHDVEAPPKDGGRRLRGWMEEWEREHGAVSDARSEVGSQK